MAITPRFARGALTPTSIRFDGRGSRERRALLHITFPHRGQWQITSAQCEYCDILGLVRLAWSVPLDVSLTVRPPEIHDTHYPVLSSSQRPGDLAVDTLNRQGDPFDIKRYHPSDGIKKIIWKAYAKRGELLSRHPEASMTPEGYVVILVLARPGDDQLASYAISYTRMLHELQLDLMLGCQGMKSLIPARTPEQALSLLVDAVWDADCSIDRLIGDASRLLEYCAKSASLSRLERLVIFCSRERFVDIKVIHELNTLCEWLTAKGITPVFCFSSRAESSAPKLTKHSLLAKLIALPEQDNVETVPAESYTAFLSGCAQRNWDVYV
jgi:uncharacterized protein (DUF58 family)